MVLAWATAEDTKLQNPWPSNLDSLSLVRRTWWRQSCFSRLFDKLNCKNCYPRVLVSATPSPWPSTAS
jgi:hypothetical protein